MKQHIAAVYHQEEIVRVFRSFAYAKLLATQSRVENYRGLCFEPWIVTQTEIVQPWRSREELGRLINEEVKFQRDHLLKLLSNGRGPAVLHQCLKSLRKAVVFFRYTATLALRIRRSTRTPPMCWASVNAAQRWLAPTLTFR